MYRSAPFQCEIMQQSRTNFGNIEISRKETRELRNTRRHVSSVTGAIPLYYSIIFYSVLCKRRVRMHIKSDEQRTVPAADCAKSQRKEAPGVYARANINPRHAHYRVSSCGTRFL